MDSSSKLDETEWGRREWNGELRTTAQAMSLPEAVTAPYPRDLQVTKYISPP